MGNCNTIESNKPKERNTVESNCVGLARSDVLINRIVKEAPQMAPLRAGRTNYDVSATVAPRGSQPG